MKKILFLIAFSVLRIFAQDNTGEVNFYIIDNSGSNVKFTVTAVSTVWDGAHNISSSYPGGTYSAQYGPQNQSVYFDLLDNNSTAPIIFGLGLYKIEAEPYTTTPPDTNSSKSNVAYFYYDLRTSYLPGPNSPDVYFDFSVSQNRFTVDGSSTNINGTTKAIWELNSYIPHETDKFEPYKPINLTQTASSGTPHLQWQHNSINDDFLTGYKVYRKIQDIDDDYTLRASVGSATTTFSDGGLELNGGGTAYYYIKAINNSKLSAASDVLNVSIIAMEKKGMGNGNPVSELTNRLYPGYPNPFNPTTMISYTIKETGFVSLTAYNILGNKVKDLVNENQQPGDYSVKFDAKNLPTGFYVIILKTNNFVSSQKVLLIK